MYSSCLFLNLFLYILCSSLVSNAQSRKLLRKFPKAERSTLSKAQKIIRKPFESKPRTKIYPDNGCELPQELIPLLEILRANGQGSNPESSPVNSSLYLDNTIYKGVYEAIPLAEKLLLQDATEMISVGIDYEKLISNDETKEQTYEYIDYFHSQDFAEKIFMDICKLDSIEFNPALSINDLEIDWKERPDSEFLRPFTQEINGYNVSAIINPRAYCWITSVLILLRAAFVYLGGLKVKVDQQCPNEQMLSQNDLALFLTDDPERETLDHIIAIFSRIHPERKYSPGFGGNPVRIAEIIFTKIDIPTYRDAPTLRFIRFNHRKAVEGVSEFIPGTASIQDKFSRKLIATLVCSTKHTHVFVRDVYLDKLFQFDNHRIYKAHANLREEYGFTVGLNLREEYGFTVGLYLRSEWDDELTYKEMQQIYANGGLFPRVDYGNNIVKFQEYQKRLET